MKFRGGAETLGMQFVGPERRLGFEEVLTEGTKDT